MAPDALCKPPGLPSAGNICPMTQSAATSRWDEWRAQMERAKADAGITYARIAARVGGGASPENVRNYFKGKARPPTELLSALARSVNAEPEEMLLALGLLSEQYASVAVELARLRRDRQRLRGLVQRELGPVAAADVVSVALRNGCAAAVYPAMEGAAFGRVSVGDRITLLPPTSGGDVPGAVKTTMSTYGGIPLRSKGRSELEHVVPERSPEYELWSIPTLTAARPVPDVRQSTTGLHSAFVTALTLAAGPLDIGSFLAYALGFGFTTTRELRAVALGGARNAQEMNRERNHAARQFTRDPTVAERWVWGHFGTPVIGKDGRELETFAPAELAAMAQPGSPLIIWLRETDALLKLHTQQTSTRFSLEELRHFQGKLAAAFAAFESNVVEVPVGPALQRPGTLRDRVMDRNVRTAASILTGLDTRYGLSLVQAVPENEETPEVLRRALASGRRPRAYSSSSSPSSSLQRR